MNISKQKLTYRYFGIKNGCSYLYLPNFLNLSTLFFLNLVPKVLKFRIVAQH